MNGLENIEYQVFKRVARKFLSPRVLARIAALEESKNQKEGPKVFRNGRDIQSVSRTTPSMRDHAKIAGQKVIQDKQLKKEKQELFQQQVQMDKCKVLTACVV